MVFNQGIRLGTPPPLNHRQDSDCFYLGLKSSAYRGIAETTFASGSGELTTSEETLNHVADEADNVFASYNFSRLFR